MRNIVICILAGLALAASAQGDTVYMKNGKVYQGEATRNDGKVYVKATMGGVPVIITVDADDVERIQESKSATRPAGQTTSAPAISLDTGRTLEDSITRPEAMVFLAMQKLAVMPPGMGTYEAQQNIKTFQAKAHDGERKAGGKWYSPKDVIRAKEKYQEIINDSRNAMNELRRAESGPPSARTEVPRYRRELAVFYRKAAAAWPDDLLSVFLTGAAQIEGLDYIAAQHTFERCIAAAPRVAAFHQGKALALAGRNQPVACLASAVDAIELQPDSQDALAFLKQSLDATPGNLMSEPTCVLAKAVMDRYEAPNQKSGGSRRGISWLLPGKSVTVWENTLPMYRLEFRQTVGVPVGKHALLADSAALDGAAEAFVVLDGKTTVPAQVVRTSTYGSSGKVALPVAVVYVRDVELAPLPADGKEKAGKDQAVSFYGLSFFEQMGGKIRPVDALVRGVDPNGAAVLSAQLLPGEGAGPVISKNGVLLGFLAGRTDPTAEGGGPDRFVPVDAMSALIKRAQQSASTGYGYSRNKRQVAPKPAPGQYFTVFVTAAEYPKRTSH
jgi:hypothetical protein